MTKRSARYSPKTCGWCRSPSHFRAELDQHRGISEFALRRLALAPAILRSALRSSLFGVIKIIHQSELVTRGGNFLSSAIKPTEDPPRCAPPPIARVVGRPSLPCSWMAPR